MTIIKPTVGRIVYFVDHHRNHTDQPEAAQIAFVLNDEPTLGSKHARVNLSVLSHNGEHRAETYVPLVQDGQTPPPGRYCYWMPYQIGQARTQPSPEAAAR